MNEVIKTEAKKEQELPSILDPTVPLPLLAWIYEGFGQGITNLAAAASIGLRLPLYPLYCGGGIMALVFAYLKLRETQNRVALRREIVLARQRDRERDHHRDYWAESDLSFIKDKERRSLDWIIEHLSAEEIAECLGYYYRCLLNASNIQSLLQRLTLIIYAEANQLNNPQLSMVLLKAAGLDYAAICTSSTPSWFSRLWFNLRKYYKSMLTGAATAGGLTVIIVESSLSTATLTLLFPWSILIILGALVVGGITGFILDKYLDRQHKNELNRIAAETLDEKNKKRLGNLWVDLGNTMNAIGDTQKGVLNLSLASPSQRPDLKSDNNEVLPPLPSLLPEIDYAEVRALKSQSHIKRKIADFILPTLIAVRISFGAVSTVFAGLAIAGLMLPWWPVVIIGGSMLGIYVIFKIINNRIKHQSEVLKTESLNYLISAEKFRYWNQTLLRDDSVRYAKESSVEQLFEDLHKQYLVFTEQLKLLQQNPKYFEILEDLGLIHKQLLLRYRVHADNLNNKDQLTKLHGMALTCLPPSELKPQIITPDNMGLWVLYKMKTFLWMVDAFLVRNLKDIITGFAFGFGTTLTIFAFMGMTSSLLAFWPLATIAGACLVGIGIRVAIRHGIKAFRNQHLLELESHAEKPIKDKEQLLDCQAETAIAVELVDQIAKKWEQHKERPQLNYLSSHALFWKNASGKIPSEKRQESEVAISRMTIVN